jgi:hypothetical protein
LFSEWGRRSGRAHFDGSGAIQTVTFKAVVPAGPDIYEVKFDKGAQEWTIWLSPEGRVDSANFRPGSKVVTPPP